MCISGCVYKGGGCNAGYLLFELVHEPVLLSLQGHHLIRSFLPFGGGEFQKGDVGVLLTDGCKQSLLSGGEVMERAEWRAQVRILKSIINVALHRIKENLRNQNDA